MALIAFAAGAVILVIRKPLDEPLDQTNISDRASGSLCLKHAQERYLDLSEGEFKSHPARMVKRVPQSE